MKNTNEFSHTLFGKMYFWFKKIKRRTFFSIAFSVMVFFSFQVVKVRVPALFAFGRLTWQAFNTAPLTPSKKFCSKLQCHKDFESRFLYDF